MNSQRRQDQKEQTHTRILAAAIALTISGGEEAVTMGAVADLVGVTERTVHRHFRTRDDLIIAVWRHLLELVGPRQPSPQTPDELAERPRTFFRRLGDHPELTRAFLYSRTRRELSSRPDRHHQEALLACVRQALEYLDERIVRRRAGIIQVITSPYAWELMRGWGFSGEEAGEAAAEAVEILLDRRLAY